LVEVRVDSYLLYGNSPYLYALYKETLATVLISLK